ncbi:glycerol-3-phosphate acyltransferase [Peribacillus sp. SCS-155]|uniref:glycerol-3-phosphate acyltransferase n=1 Tax=Peribacillus sedimenti TaxID=3115297 RepID=UPI00390593B4
MSVLVFVIVVAVSYLMGCVNGAYYLAKHVAGKDIRQFGSQNAGARNAGRLLGKWGFAGTVMIDAGKTLLALEITNKVSGGNGYWLVFAAFLVLVGHIWPLHLELRGGKGVVVYLAAALYFTPLSILVTAAILAVLFAVFRRFTIPGLIALASIPVTTFIAGHPWIYTAGLLFMLAAVVYAHIAYNPV